MTVSAGGLRQIEPQHLTIPLLGDLNAFLHSSQSLSAFTEKEGILGSGLHLPPSVRARRFSKGKNRHFFLSFHNILNYRRFRQ